MRYQRMNKGRIITLRIPFRPITSINGIDRYRFQVLHLGVLIT